MNLTNLKQQYIHALHQEKAFLISETPRPLHHGEVSHLYLNHNQFLSKYEHLELLTKIYLQLLPKKLGSYSLGAVDSVMSPVLCGLLASTLHKNVVVIKEKKLEHGLQNQVYGEAVKEVVLIDDVTSTGTILINAAQVLRDKGIEVKYALISSCRDLTAIEKLKEANIQPLYIATYEEIIRELWNSLAENEQALVHQEAKEKGYNWNI